MSPTESLTTTQADIQQATSDRPAGTAIQPCPLQKKSWIEIKLVGMDNVGIADEPYLIVAADGQEIRGKTDAKGWARASNIVPGACKVSFPELDQEFWEPA